MPSGSGAVLFYAAILTLGQLGRQGLPRGTGLRAWQRLSDDRRALRLATYEKVMALHAQGGTMKGIGRELAIDHRTVRNFIVIGAFPERARRARGPTPLDAHRHYIEERIAQGCRCARPAILSLPNVPTIRPFEEEPRGHQSSLTQVVKPSLF